MIKRLKRRFIAVNMTILTCVLFAVLTSVFVLMYRSEVRMSEKIMDSLIADAQHQSDNPDAGQPQDINPMVFSTDDAAIMPLALFDEEQPYYWRTDDSPYYDYEYYYENADTDYEQYQYRPPYPDYDEIFPPEDEPPYPPEWETTTQATTFVTTTTTTTTYHKTEPYWKTDMSGQETPHRTEPLTTTTVATPPIVAPTTTALTTAAAIVTPESTPRSETTITTTTTTTAASAAQNPPVDRSYVRSSIMVTLSDNNVIEAITSKYNETENVDQVSSAVQQIIADGQQKGKITVDDVSYRYKLSREKDNTYSLVLLDRSIELSTLSRLLFIFVIIGCIALIGIFGISVLLANWTIKPIALAWDKQKQFVADASHELKTPLAVISTNMDLILTNPNDTVIHQEKWLNYIKAETTRMTKLVSNLLYIAKSDSKQIATTFTSMDLSDLVSSVCLVFEPTVFEHQKTMECRIQPNIFYSGDCDRLKQLLTILLDNAVIHSTAHAHITVSLSEDCQNKIRLAVSNTGRDIPADKLEKIFDRFYRLDESRATHTGGSGLGLNIAQTIVEQHAGSLIAHSENGIVSFIATL